MLAMREHHQQPLVSIGLPVWNGARYLAEAVESILSQTYRCFAITKLGPERLWWKGEDVNP